MNKFLIIQRQLGRVIPLTNGFVTTVAAYNVEAVVLDQRRVALVGWYKKKNQEQIRSNSYFSI